MQIPRVALPRSVQSRSLGMTIVEDYHSARLKPHPSQTNLRDRLSAIIPESRLDE